MGIPKFYRWLSERYPLINVSTASVAIPVIDNLYFDMNGIIHNCTHGNDPNRKPTETEMLLKIFDYLDKLVHLVQPQRLLFLAIDGCAPRAKMNQQRARRFKSALERGLAQKEAQAAGGLDQQAQEQEFDSNCITPGTPFMQRLGAHLRFFIRRKIATDAVWQQPEVVFSGHEVPGEGEHKIMEHIRLGKASGQWAPNQRHCLYGLDADLIMLALVSHEPFFCLLREVVSYGKGGKGQPSREVLDNPCADSFVLLHIELLREYFGLEFGNLQLPFPVDVERIIDDFVLFCMFTGNDFLPPLPTFDIAEGALDKMFALYKQALPQLGGYITHAGSVNLPRLEVLLSMVAALEQQVLEERATDAEWMANKQARREGREANGVAYVPPPQREPLQSTPAFAGLPINEELGAMGNGHAEPQNGAAASSLLDAPLEAEEPAEAAAPAGATMMSKEARQLFASGDGATGLAAWKARHYREKLHVAPGAERRVVQDYVQGLQWVLQYYYRGVASWSWFYPHHYAPLASDIVQVQDMQADFSIGQPLLPFQQLLSVLPAASRRLLPTPYQELMTDPASPILDFFPGEFRVDLEGKRADWEGVVLIPFLDVERLQQAVGLIPQSALTAEEHERNRLGCIFSFCYSEDAAEPGDFCTTTLPGILPSIASPYSTVSAGPPHPPLPPDAPGFVPELAGGTSPTQPPAGFATLSTLPLHAELRAAAVEVLGAPSKRESLLLTVQEGKARGATAAKLAQQLDQRVHVGWPFLREAIIHAVADKSIKVTAAGAQLHDAAGLKAWADATVQTVGRMRTKQGVVIGGNNIVLEVRPCQGLARGLDGTLEKRFAKKAEPYPLQVCVWNHAAQDPRTDPEAAAARLASVKLQAGDQALFLGRAHYGCVATVQQVDEASGMLRVGLQPAPTTAGVAMQTARRILSDVQVSYMPSGQVARKAGMSFGTIGQLTGELRVTEGEASLQLGLCIKLSSKGLHVPDYAAPGPEGRGWVYSQDVAVLLKQYKARFPWVVSAVEDKDEEKRGLKGLDLLPDEPSPEARLQQLRQVEAWLGGLPFAGRPLVKGNAQVAPAEAVHLLQGTLPVSAQTLPTVELESVDPALLLPTAAAAGSLFEVLTGGSVDVGDRVAYARGSAGAAHPPLGFTGTVIGIYDAAAEVLWDREFPEGSSLNGRCKGKAGQMLPAADLLNLSKPSAVSVGPKRAARKLPAAAAPPPPSVWGPAASRPGLPMEDGAHGSPPALGAPKFRGQPQRRHRGNSPPKQRLRQPVCPPTKNARGFAAGRGRASAPPASSAPGAPGAQAPGQAPKPAPPSAAPVPVAKSQAQQASPAPAQLPSSPPGIPHGFPPGVPQAPGPVPLPPTAQPTLTGRQGSPFPAAPEAPQAPSAGNERMGAEGPAAQSSSSAPTAEASADRPTRGWLPDADQVLEQLAQLQPGSRSTTPQPGSQGPPLLPTPPRPDQLPTNLGLRQQAAFQGQATAQHGYPAPGPAQAPNPAAWSQVFSQGLPSPAGAQPSSSAGPPLSGLDLLLSLQRTQQQQQQQQQLQLQSQAVAAQHAGLGPQHLQQLQQQLPAEQAMRYQSPQGQDLLQQLRLGAKLPPHLAERPVQPSYAAPTASQPARDFLSSLQRPQAAYAGYGQPAAPANPALEALLAGRGQQPAAASPAHLGFPGSAAYPGQGVQHVQQQQQQQQQQQPQAAGVHSVQLLKQLQAAYARQQAAQQQQQAQQSQHAQTQQHILAGMLQQQQRSMQLPQQSAYARQAPPELLAERARLPQGSYMPQQQQQQPAYGLQQPQYGSQQAAYGLQQPSYLPQAASQYQQAARAVPGQQQGAGATSAQGQQHQQYSLQAAYAQASGPQTTQQMHADSVRAHWDMLSRQQAR